jgi:hypothetical protein
MVLHVFLIGLSHVLGQRHTSMSPLVMRDALAARLLFLKMAYVVLVPLEPI